MKLLNKGNFISHSLLSLKYKLVKIRFEVSNMQMLEK